MTDAKPEPASTKYPCPKNDVRATLITHDGQSFTGTNRIAVPVTVCPRVEAGYARGQGYHLCREVCGQEGHAERMALEAAMQAKADTECAVIYLEGHDERGGPGSTYPNSHVCPDCQSACNAAGIAFVAIGAPPATEVAT